MSPFHSFAVASILAAVSAAGDQPVSYIAAPFVGTAGAKVDGLRDEAFWAQAAFAGQLVLSDGSGMPEARTASWLAPAHDALLVAVRCDEPLMHGLTSSVTRHDGEVWQDDCVELFIQRPGSEYFHFVVNPEGTRFEEKGQDPEWNAPWEAAARKAKDAWSVEFRIPWASLGGEPKPGDEWRLNICRSRRPVKELSAWSATGGTFHAPGRFGILRFGAETWLTELSWGRAGRGNNTATVAVRQSPGQPGAVARIGDGEWTPVPAEGKLVPYAIKREGNIRLHAEVRAGDRLIARVPLALRILPVLTRISECRDELTQLQALNASVEECKSGLIAELDSLVPLAEDADERTGTALLKQIGAITRRSQSLTVQAAFAQKSDERLPKAAYGIEIPLRKLLKHERFQGRTGGALKLEAARREIVAGQVVVFAFEEPLLQARLILPELHGPDGATIPASALRWRRVGYVKTEKPTYAVPHVGLWPDPLVPAESFDVAPWDFETAWVDLRAPETCPAGLYKGEAAIAFRNAPPMSMPIELHVWDFALPKENHLRTAFGLGLAPTYKQDWDSYFRNYLEHRISPYGFGGPELVTGPAMDWTGYDTLELDVHVPTATTMSVSIRPSGDARAVVLQRQLRAGENNGIPVDLKNVQGLVSEWQVRASGAPWAVVSARLLGEGKQKELVHKRRCAAAIDERGWLVQWTGLEANAWESPDKPPEFDWADFDKKAASYLPLGVTGCVVRLPSVGRDTPLQTAADAIRRNGLRLKAQAWEEHLKQNNMLQLGYTYLFDEPTPEHYPVLNLIMGTVKRAAPGLKNMMTARRFPEELHYVDIWCPEAYSFDPEAARREQERGRAVWWYVAFSTRHPYPDVWVDYPALDCRVWPWMTWKHNLDGMLYWSATYWHKTNPWHSAHTYPGANGDGCLLYPGEDGGPVDSIRWECLRDGLQDYEVFCLLEAGLGELRAKGLAPELQQRIRKLLAVDDSVVRSYKEYNQDPAALLTARRQMSAAAEEMTKALGREPDIKERPRHRPGVDVAQAPPLPEVQTHEAGAAWRLPKPLPGKGLRLRYSFDENAPFIPDLSGNGLHALVRGAARTPGVRGNALSFDGQAWLELPGGERILGPRPATGAVCLWAKAGFDPASAPSGQWEGYQVLFYLMKTDGNGLPDGYDEIGIYHHGQMLHARCGGRPAAVVGAPSPLKPDEWVHVAMTWSPAALRLYANGELAAESASKVPAPELDDFTGAAGAHPPHLRWRFEGAIDDVRVYDRELPAAEIRDLARTTAD